MTNHDSSSRQGVFGNGRAFPPARDFVPPGMVEMQRESAECRHFIHEIRNALTPVTNGLHLLRHDSDEEVRARAIEMIERQVERIATLLDELTESARAGM